MTARLLPVLLALALGGCAAVANVQSAGQTLDSFELTALPPATTVARGNRHLIIELPTASGALTTERIAVKPNAYEVSYLPGARWVDPAPEHLQLLLARSLTGTGRFALVSAGGGRPDPDWYLETDLQDFQVEIGADGRARVSVALRAVLVSDVERQVRAARTFSATVPTASTGAADVIPAFDAATTRVLRSVTDWTTRTLG